MDISSSVTACHARLVSQLAALERAPLLLFGYASLIWRPEVAFTAAPRACAGGFHRRLWQASPDPRGTPAALGRVATLVPACPRAWRARLAGGGPPGPPFAAAGMEDRALRAWLARCEAGAAPTAADGGAAAAPAAPAEEEGGAPPVVHGTVFTLERECARAMLERLCLRERAGYQLLCVRLALEGGGEVDAFTFSGSTGSGFGAEFWAPAPPAELAVVVATAEGASGRNLVYFFELLRSMRGWGVVDPHLELIWAALLKGHRDAVAAVLGEAALLLEKGAAPA